jgi:ankyrin repeat protein
VDSGAHLDIPAERLQNMTPLHLSALRGFFEIAIYLIENGADIATRDNSGRTPLHTVAMAIYDGKYLALFRLTYDIFINSNTLIKQWPK